MINKNYVLITGGTRGIGLGVAKILAENGYPLVLTYKSDEKTAQEALRSIKTSEQPHYILKADGAEWSSIDDIDAFLTEKGIDRLSGLILNAGETLRTEFDEMTQTEWEHIFRVNIHVPTFLLQRLKMRLAVSRGTVVFSGSSMGVHPHSTSLAYGASKSAVHSLVKNMVKHFEPIGVRVNAIAPGFIETDWHKNKPQEIRKSIESKIALHRFSTPEEIAEAYWFVFNNQYVNGAIIEVDGGYSFK